MARRNRPRVLVVDDSKETAECMALVLRMWGYEVKACYDGLAALATSRDFRPHIVLLDIAMPGMDGLQLARRLREQPDSSAVALIAITGYSTEACRSQGRQVGLFDYLIKPVDPEYLHEILLRIEGQKRLLEALSAGDDGSLTLDLEGAKHPSTESGATGRPLDKWIFPPLHRQPQPLLDNQEQS